MIIVFATALVAGLASRANDPTVARNGGTVNRSAP
jgi:hypothetical protein